MSTPLLQQLDAERQRVEANIAELQAKRKQLALASRGKTSAAIDKIDSDLQRIDRELALIADATVAAEAEAADHAERDVVQALADHVNGALELAEGRVSAAARIDAALDELCLALGSFHALGEGAWQRAVQAGSIVDPQRLPQGIEHASGFALGGIDAVLSGLSRACRAEPRLRNRVEIHGFTDPVPTCEQRAEDELQRLRACLLVHASPAAREAASEARSRVADPVAQDLRADRLYANLQAPTFPTSLTVGIHTLSAIQEAA
jgi:hypothetical protein